MSISLMIMTSCKKEDHDVEKPLTFTSLIAQEDTIFPGGTTSVTALADGDEITYSWSASAGDVVGSGSVINYVSPPCTVGNNQITCVVKDKANNSITKSITIVVL